MTVRPVDMITLLPRLNEAGRTVQQAEHQPALHSQVQAARQQERADRAERQVNQKTPSHQVGTRQDGGGRGQNGQPQQKKASAAKSAEPKENGTDLAPGHKLDVKV